MSREHEVCKCDDCYGGGLEEQSRKLHRNKPSRDNEMIKGMIG